MPDHAQCCQSVAASTQAHAWAIIQLQPLFRSLGHDVRVQSAVTVSRGQQRGDMQLKGHLKHNSVERDLVFDLFVTHERWGASKEPSKNGHFCYPDDLNRPLREAARKTVLQYQSTHASNHSITLMPAISSTAGRLDAEFLRLLFWHAHREGEEILRLTGQLEQPNQDSVFSKRTAFSNSVKSNVGHIWRRPVRCA